MSGCYKCWEGGGGLELVKVGAVGGREKGRENHEKVLLPRDVHCV